MFGFLVTSERKKYQSKVRNNFLIKNTILAEFIIKNYANKFNEKMISENFPLRLL